MVNLWGQTILQGEGAGPGPTSSALMSDLLSVLRGNIKYSFGSPNKKRKRISFYDSNKYLSAVLNNKAAGRRTEG